MRAKVDRRVCVALRRDTLEVSRTALSMKPEVTHHEALQVDLLNDASLCDLLLVYEE